MLKRKPVLIFDKLTGTGMRTENKKKTMKKGHFAFAFFNSIFGPILPRRIAGTFPFL
jgi:hypothetical protein